MRKSYLFSLHNPKYHILLGQSCIFLFHLTLLQIISILVTSKNPIYQGEKEVKKDYIKKFLRLHVFNLHFYVVLMK